MKEPLPRPWRDLWWVIRDALTEISIATGSQASKLGVPVLRSRFSRFFVEMDHLRDWLSTDDDELPHVTEAMVNQFAFNNDQLRVVNALSNTTKHRKRRSGMVADITAITFSPVRAIVNVSYAEGLEHMGVTDALVLARGAIDAWGQFFDKYGITAPS